MAMQHALSYLAESSILLHPPHVRWAWLAVLLRTQKGGIVPSLTPTTLALAATLSIEEAAEALAVFTSPDPCPIRETVDDPTGRRLLSVVADEIDRVGPDAFRVTEWARWTKALGMATQRTRMQQYRRRKAARRRAPEAEHVTAEPAEVGSRS